MKQCLFAHILEERQIDNMWMGKAEAPSGSNYFTEDKSPEFITKYLCWILRVEWKNTGKHITVLKEIYINVKLFHANRNNRNLLLIFSKRICLKDQWDHLASLCLCFINILWRLIFQNRLIKTNSHFRESHE